MTDPLPIVPFTSPAAGRVELPGSKSITNRALILAALTNETVTLRNALFSRDTQIMVQALSTLGFEVAADEAAKTIAVTGHGGDIPVAEASLHVGNAGTAARFLTAFLSLKKGGAYHLDGDPAMRERPMKGLLDALVKLGAQIEYPGNAGHFPFTLKTTGLDGGRVEMEAEASSQLLSALLMAGTRAREDLRIAIAGKQFRRPFVDMTLAMLEQFGQSVETDESSCIFTIRAGNEVSYPAGSYLIESDASAASYFVALPLAVRGSVRMTPWASEALQGDTAFFQVLKANTRLKLRNSDDEFEASFNGERRLGTGHKGINKSFNAFSDTFLTLAAIAPLLEGATRITGIGHTRKQETDRIAAMATELRKLGQPVEEEEDALTVHPDIDALREAARKGVAIDTYEDHRVAMSFAILGCADLRGNGEPWLTIRDPGCVAKTFPRFFEVLEQLRTDSSR